MSPFESQRNSELKNEKGAHMEWRRGIEREELVDQLVSGFSLGSMKEDVVKNILKEEEQMLRAAGENAEDIKTALKKKLLQLGAK